MGAVAQLTGDHLFIHSGAPVRSVVLNLWVATSLRSSSLALSQGPSKTVKKHRNLQYDS